MRKYVDLGSDERYIVVTLWAIGTYFSKSFSYYPYLDFFGTKGSAKSKVLKFLEQIIFNGMWFNNVSGASAIRSIESLGCTLLLDETENLKNPQSDEAKFLLKLLKGAFATDSKIMINNQTKDGWMPYPFDAGTCIAMGHINGIDDVLEDRTISVPIQATLNKQIAQSDINKDDDVWQEIRNWCYRAFLQHFDDIEELVKMPYPSNIISNLELNQIWRPIITLARLFERNGISDLVQKVDVVINESHKHKQLVNQTSNLDVQILEHLVAYLNASPLLEQVKNNSDWYKQDDILRRLQKEDDLSWIKSSRLVGEALTRLGFKRKKITIGQVVFINKNGLRISCMRHSIDFPSFPSLSSHQEQNLDAYGDVDDASDVNIQNNGHELIEISQSTSVVKDDADDGITNNDSSFPSLSLPPQIIKNQSTDVKTHYMCFTCNPKGTEPFPLGVKTSNGLTEKDHENHKLLLLDENELKEIQFYDVHGGLKPDVLRNVTKNNF